MPAAPLARDAAGRPFDLPENAAYWRVSKVTGGRPRKVDGPDDRWLHISVASSEQQLADRCEPASYRLEAVDANLQPVGAPIAVVDLASDDLPSSNATEAHAPVDAMARTMESMQRSQHARETQMGERERWQMQALVESQKAWLNFTSDLFKAVVERIPGGKPSIAASPVEIIKQHAELQKFIDAQAKRRNAALVGHTDDDDTDDDDDDGNKGAAEDDWMAQMRKVTDAVTPALNSVRDIVFAFRGTPQPTGSTRALPPIMAEVLAQLSDDERQRIASQLSSASDESIAFVAGKLALLPTIEARVAWVREQLGAIAPPPPTPSPTAPLRSWPWPPAPAATPEPQQAAPPEPTPPRNAAVDLVSSLPPSLLPVLRELAPEEAHPIIVEIFGSMDTASLEQCAETLARLPVVDAADRLRRALAKFRQQAAARAQRAMRQALDGTETPPTNNGGKNAA
jgi:hypothetical protein